MAANSKSRTKAKKRPASARRPVPSRAAPAAPEPVVNRIAVATAPGLASLARLPKFLMPALVAVGVVGGLALGGIAGLVCLLAVVALLGWLLAAFWPLIPASGRVLRVAALIAVLAVGIINL